MKQKLTAALLALACLFSLAACGKNDADPAGYTLEALDLMAKEGAFSEELESLDGDTAFALYKLADYGLSREEAERRALTVCEAEKSIAASSFSRSDLSLRLPAGIGSASVSLQL